MKDRILNILELNRGGALSLDDLYKKLGYSNLSKDDFLAVIDDLKDDKKIYCVNSKLDLYTLNPFCEGVYHILRSGKDFVTVGDKEYSVDNSKRLNLMDKDKVLIRITDFASLKCTVKEIINRSGIIAEIKTIKGKRYAVTSDNVMYKVDDLSDRIVDGMMVGIKIDTSKAGNYYHAKLDRVIAHKNAPKIDERKILYENGFAVDFSEDVFDELKSFPTECDANEIKNRRDLREKMIFTIDGDDTKDIDDAVSLEILDNGNYLLGVHIADVSYYVKENSHLDLEARERGTSVYMPGVVSPMYPPQLSNGICSLNPNVDRFAFSCDMEFDNNGKLIDFDIYKSVIKSNIQMTYKNVNKILDENYVPSGYENYVETLKEMNKLASIFKKSRKERGMLDFDSKEVKILVENDKVLDIIPREQGTGETLIEYFMLAANECVATYAYNMFVSFIYRDHDDPNYEKLTNVVKILKNYGVKINTKIKVNDPRCIQVLLEELKDDDNYDIYSNMVLRCMAKASYKTSNFGHFGLGIKAYKNEAYTHFTSPIRRYPDTMVHRILSMILDGDSDKLMQDSYKEFLTEIANHSSEMELLADDCEREANKMNMATYISKYINKSFKGKVVGFTNHGMYIKLDNYVEGRVSYSSMDDFYRYDPDMEIIVGDRTKKIYRLGDKVNVVVVKASRDSREIDFEIVRKDIRNKHGDNK